MNDQASSYAALILRISLGSMFIAHALLKLLVFTLPGTAQFFSSVGIPGELAYVVFIVELVGGTMLITGFYSRWVSLMLIPVLIGAVSVHWPNGWVFSNPNGGWEYPVVLVMMSVVQSLLGDGAYALRPVVQKLTGSGTTEPVTQ